MIAVVVADGGKNGTEAAEPCARVLALRGYTLGGRTAQEHRILRADAWRESKAGLYQLGCTIFFFCSWAAPNFFPFS
jgi:hypothetical protein